MFKKFKNVKASVVLKALIVPLLIICFCIALDQVTKYLVVQNMAEGEQIVLIKNFLSLYHIKNPGAAFGSFPGGRTFFIIITAIAIPVVFFLLVGAFDGHPLYRVSLSMVIGGGIGNFIDRVAFGVVTDMIRIDYFGKELFGSTFFPIFNVADISLVVGGILLIVYVLFFYYDKKNPEEVKKHEEKMEKKAQKRAERKAKKLCKDVESVEDFLARTEVDAATATEEENGGV